MRLERHGHLRLDPYGWLRERDDPQVVAYLEAENAYADAALAHTRELEETLFTEIRGRIRQTDESVPYREGEWYYLTRWLEGSEYPLLYRRRGATDGPEELLLDVNALAAGHDYCSLRGWRVSPDGDRLAYAVDTVGRGLATLRIQDLETRTHFPETIFPVVGSLEWAADGRTLFYARQDPVTLRSHRIWRHRVASDPEEDFLVYEEADERFYCFLDRTKSRRYVVIDSFQSVTSEVRLLRTDRPDDPPILFLRRRHGHEYDVDHLGNRFFVRSNLGAPNFRLLEVPEAWLEERPEAESERLPEAESERLPEAEGGALPAAWRELVPERDDVLLEGVELFRDHVALEERSEARVRLRVRRLSDGAEHVISSPEPCHVAWLGENHAPDAPFLRFGYSSLTTPNSVYDYDLRTRERTLRKREEVVGGYDADAYEERHLIAAAPDGTGVPISLVYRKDRRRDGGNPLLLYGYGAYGLSMDPAFSSPRLTLLDRGFVFAIAHVRGGQELGRRWYDEGRLLAKRNTFTDFIACARQLVSEGWTRPGMLFAHGRSAGGLLIGTVANMAPELFCGMVADVPFVDVLTTMLDPSIPLTTGEYEEWGDPTDPDHYGYILSYSPYDNVEAKAYPALLVTASFHDSQVQYWEPAKWTAKLRALKTDDRPLLLRTEMAAGHAGPSARSQRWREIARRHAFLLDLAAEA